MKTMEKKLTADDFLGLKNRDELIELAQEKEIDIDNHLANLEYEKELKRLQIELVNLQHWVKKNNKRVAVIFEGRDASGKGGCIKRFKEHLNPRTMRVVALNKPTEVERGQWYFRRYIKELPNPGEIVFFDRSWYNRAVVEPVMDFCDKDQYNKFMVQVPEFEHMLYEDDLKIIKFWFSVSKDEQKARFDKRLKSPLKQWKFSPVDVKGQELWEKYTLYKDQMFSRTHTPFSPWTIVKTNNKKKARLESMRHVLAQFDYDGKGDSGANLFPNPNVILRYYRHAKQID